MTNRAWTKARGARWLALAFVAYGCNSDVNDPRSTGESHFLDYCDSSCGDGLDCISGVCTRGCLVAENSCGDLAADASCTDQSIEPGKVAVCDVECSDDADCESIAAGHRCDAGYCRGGEPVPNGQGGEGGGTGGKPNTGGTAPTGGTASTGGTAPTGGIAGAGGEAGGGALECSRGIVSWDYELDTGVAFECQACDCAERTACEPLDCNEGAPVYPCSQTELDDFPAEYAYDVIPHFQGDVLEIDVQVGGGCEAHTLSVCFDPAFRESNPVATTLRIRHELPGDVVCDALMSETLRFDLSPLRSYYESAYRTDTGIIATNYGAYGFGELSCDERRRVVSDQVQRAADSTRKSCTNDEDCAAVSMSTKCAGGCQAAVSHFEQEALTAEIERIGSALCSSCAPLPTGCPPATARCEEGVCRAD